MFKRYSIASLFMLGIAALPVQAQQQNTPEWWNKENISKGVGAITGAIVGSQIGGGRGRAAAIALGTLAGYWVGGRVGAYLTEKDRDAINQATTRAISTGQSTTWRNPDTGTLTEVTAREPASIERKGLQPAVDRLPPIELLNSWYMPNANINVRGGPGTQYRILHTIRRGERVPVIGKVVNRDWYLIAEQGGASGFLYAPLMRLDGNQGHETNAIRIASGYPQPGRGALARQECRTITQKVSLSNGESESHHFDVCQKSNGNWERI